MIPETKKSYQGMSKTSLKRRCKQANVMMKLSKRDGGKKKQFKSSSGESSHKTSSPPSCSISLSSEESLISPKKDIFDDLFLKNEELELFNLRKLENKFIFTEEELENILRIDAVKAYEEAFRKRETYLFYKKSKEAQG